MMRVRPVVGDISRKQTGTYANIACLHTRPSLTRLHKQNDSEQACPHGFTDDTIGVSYRHFDEEPLREFIHHEHMPHSKRPLSWFAVHSHAALWVKMPWEWMERAVPPTEILCYAVKNEVRVKRAAKVGSNVKTSHSGEPSEVSCFCSLTVWAACCKQFVHPLLSGRAAAAATVFVHGRVRSPPFVRCSFKRRPAAPRMLFAHSTITRWWWSAILESTKGESGRGTGGLESSRRPRAATFVHPL